jgi:vacuolar-type H+-ATPase subunit F/Vma7
MQLIGDRDTHFWFRIVGLAVIEQYAFQGPSAELGVLEHFRERESLQFSENGMDHDNSNSSMNCES